MMQFVRHPLMRRLMLGLLDNGKLPSVLPQEAIASTR